MSLLNKSCQGNLLETVLLLQTHNFSPKKKKIVFILTHSPQLDPPKHQKAMHLVKKSVFRLVSTDLFIRNKSKLGSLKKLCAMQLEDSISRKR
jgi:hypothetical protein